MIKKTVTTVFIFVLALALVACSAFSNLSAAVPAIAPATTPNTSDSVLENNLAVGILKLENTELALTTDQANSMLLLWQGVRSLTSSQSASALELAALYQQIKETLTTEQAQAIRELNWTQEELTAWMQSAGGAAQGGATARKTGSASTQAQPGSDMGGPGGSGGGPGGSSDMALINGISAPNMGATQATATPVKTGSGVTNTSLTTGLNAKLAPAVINLLQKRVAA